MRYIPNGRIDLSPPSSKMYFFYFLSLSFTFHYPFIALPSSEISLVCPRLRLFLNHSRGKFCNKLLFTSFTAVFPRGDSYPFSSPPSFPPPSPHPPISRVSLLLSGVDDINGNRKFEDKVLFCRRYVTKQMVLLAITRSKMGPRGTPRST